MNRDGDPQLDAFAVDVHDLLARNVASLYSHLVTRPTGRAVRLAIEAQLDEVSGRPVLTVVDFSSVAVLDYSCADEVVAKLLLRRRLPEMPPTPAREAFFVFRGVCAHHREPVLEVLTRHGLAAVVQEKNGSGGPEVLGTISREEEDAWKRVQAAGTLSVGELTGTVPHPDAERLAGELAGRGLVFRNPLRGDLHALSALVRGPS